MTPNQSNNPNNALKRGAFLLRITTSGFAKQGRVDDEQRRAKARVATLKNFLRLTLERVERKFYLVHSEKLL